MSKLSKLQVCPTNFGMPAHQAGNLGGLHSLQKPAKLLPAEGSTYA